MKVLTGKSGRLLAVLCLVATVVVFTQPPQSAAGDLSSKAKTKNVILLIADGTGFNHMLATDYYQHGAAGSQVYESFPTKLAVSTYEFEYKDYIYDSTNFYGFVESGKYKLKGYLANQAWSDFNYAIQLDPKLPPFGGWYANNNTDSASAATAMATGFKTKDGAIGYAFPLDADGKLVVDADGKSYLEPKQNIVEVAEALGKATGIVSSVPFSHATPAGFVAHNASRGNTVAIANEMLYQSQVDVIMAPGSPDYQHNGTYNAAPAASRYTEYLGGPAVFADLQDGTLDNPNNVDANHDGVVDADDQFVVIRDQADFQSMASGSTPKRVFGLPKVRQTLQYYRDGDTAAAPFAVPFIPGVPTLPEMAKAALNVLDDDPDGFFLMIEGGAVDWAGHSSVKGRMIEELTDFNKTVEAVVAWVEKNSNWTETSVIVTADHETGYLWGPGSNPTFEPLVNNGAGVMPGMQFYSPIGWHSNSLVPLFAKGDGVKVFKSFVKNMDRVRGPFIDNTDIFRVVKKCFETNVAQ